MNGDGKTDLITANWNTASLSVLLNTTVFPSPALAITRSGNSLRVSWPSPSTGWTLRQNATLSPLGWSAGTGIADDGATKSLTLSSPAGTRFFRLSNP